MSTVVVVNTYTHSVTYVANNLLMCLKEIIRCSGLDPGKIAEDWTFLERGLERWLKSGHLKRITLEVFDPQTDKFVGGWEFSIAYEWDRGAGNFWVDTDQIRYAILKQGLWPSNCGYEVILTVRPGYSKLPGWSTTQLRSTDGFVRQSIGTTMDASGLGAAASYYRKI